MEAKDYKDGGSSNRQRRKEYSVKLKARRYPHFDCFYSQNNVKYDL